MGEYVVPSNEPGQLPEIKLSSGLLNMEKRCIFGAAFQSRVSAFCTCSLATPRKCSKSTKRFCYRLPNVVHRQKWGLDSTGGQRSQTPQQALYEWKQQSGIVTLDWPSQSPDANPIENVWPYIKHKLREKRTYTLKQLSRGIRRIWRTLSLEYTVNLVESMPRRCQAIIDADGDWWHY